ncbi:hypothetical protein N431DRAFT_475731 [Stipitochalara longipes BDJ]|nr:hypothetical protein N431DRAFT_475731 [Stipitochalara longipes BDJ]
MLPLNYYYSPFRAFISRTGASNIRPPFSDLNRFISAAPSDTEIENSILRRQISIPPYCIYPRPRQFYNTHPHFVRDDRFIPIPSSLHIPIKILIVTPISNDLHVKDEFTATIPPLATIEDVHNNLVRELNKSFQDTRLLRLPPRHVEIRVYSFHDRWRRLALFRDVLEFRAERGVEGCVVVVEW